MKLLYANLNNESRNQQKLLNYMSNYTYERNSLGRFKTYTQHVIITFNLSFIHTSFTSILISITTVLHSNHLSLAFTHKREDIL